MIETTDSNIHPIDSLIERTLLRDAETTRSRFSILPNAQLTAKLALATASRGLLGSLGAKLALYAGGALLVGSAAYFIPSIGQHPMTPTTTVHPAAHGSATTVSDPTLLNSESDPSAGVASASSNPTNSVSLHTVKHSTKANTLKIDEGDGKNLRRITDPQYGPPTQVSSEFLSVKS